MAKPAASEGAETPEETPAAKPADPTVEKLERDKKIAELKKAIAEAEKAELAAKLPKTEAKGSDGGATINAGAGYFGELLAYQALDEAAEKVAKVVGDAKQGKTKIFITVDLEIAKQAQLWDILDTKLRAFDARADELDSAYPEKFDFKAQEAVVETIAAVTAILGAAADVVAFFRSSTELSSRSVTLSERALLALTAKHLNEASWQIIDPSFSLKRTALATQLETLLAKRATIVTRRRALEKTIAPLLTDLATKRVALEEAKAKLTELEKEDPTKPAAIQAAKKDIAELRQAILPLATAEGRWTRASAEIDVFLTALDAFVKAISEGAEGKSSPLEAVAQVDALKSHPTSSILLLDISSQGAEIHVTKSVWSTRLTYLGGTVITFFLTNHEGEIEKSGAVSCARAAATRAKDAPSELKLPDWSERSATP